MAVDVPVFDGLTLEGQVNTSDETLLANVRSSIRRGYPQVWPMQQNGLRVCLVGGGPSLESTFDELRHLYFEGAKVVTVNGSYNWCLERNIRPSAQIVVDARPANARFVIPEVPQCRYYLASQCAPETWDAVEGYEHVAIWHHVGDDALKAELDRYYLEQWTGIGGGTTVGLMAIGLLRTLGFLRFDLFGFDACFMGDQHHAYPQAENDSDKRWSLVIAPTGAPEKARIFDVAGWHVKQLEDLILLMRECGDKFLLNIHGDGLLAYALSSSADVTWSLDESSRE